MKLTNPAPVLPKFTIGEADSESAFLTNAGGHDFAAIRRYMPDVYPYLPEQHHLDSEQWQGVIDTIHAAPRLAAACHGLDLPPDIAPGALAELVTAARSLLTRATDGLDQSATHDGLANCEAIARTRAALAPFTTDPAPVLPNQLTPESQEALRLALVSATPGQLVKWRPVFTETKTPTPGKP